ncbi:MAG: hypothetical protein ACREX3_00090 [Gammaproteobacteria bacterium]
MLSDDEQQSELKLMGFEAGETVHYAEDQRFTLDDVQRSLFSRYSAPHPLVIRIDDCIGVMRIVVTSATSVYEAYTERTDDGPLGCLEYPSWKLEGWLMKSGFDPYSEVIRVRMYLKSQMTDQEFSGVYIQRIPTNPDPKGLIYQAP